MSDNNEPIHWLVRPTTIRKLWYLFSAVLAATVLLQAVIPVKGYFAVDGWFGFGAAYGFVSCLLMVLVAKVLGYVLKRPQSYFHTTDKQQVPKKPDNSSLENTDGV